jgi:two-component system sensor histidine kinase MprB
MTFRRRIVVLAAAAVAVAVALAAVVTYVVVRHDLRAGIDASLRGLPKPAVFVAKGGGVPPGPGEAGGGVSVTAPAKDGNRFMIRVQSSAVGGATGLAQQAYSTGQIVKAPKAATLPVTQEVRDVGKGKRKPFFRDVTVAGTHFRVYTTRVARGIAMERALPLSDVDRTLGRLRWILLVVALGGIGLAAGFGIVVSRAAASPLGRLTGAAERVTATGDLGHRLEGEGDDEPGRLAAAFNAMLGALESSRDAQRQLVADASHELRTPLTAIRANVELLQRANGMAPGERAEVLASVRGQLEDLTVLVGDLVDLARPGEPAAEPPEELRLDELVREAVARARRHAPTARLQVSSEPCVVLGSRAALARAIGNLLDNAVKWSPPDEPVEVGVHDGEVTVRDHGPGIPDEDLPHVFDRFYRAPAARGLPGSGLGLAIVKHVADGHGGSACAQAAPGGGALLRLSLPLSVTS